MLLHAKRHWPEAITTMLWPMAFKEAIRRDNELKPGPDKKPQLRGLQIRHTTLTWQIITPGGALFLFWTQGYSRGRVDYQSGIHALA